VNKTNSDVEMDHADQLKACVQELIALVQLKDHSDVKLELVLLILTAVQLLLDAIRNSHKDVLRPDNVPRLMMIVQTITLM
jgi:hypothetical protein